MALHNEWHAAGGDRMCVCVFDKLLLVTDIMHTVALTVSHSESSLSVTILRFSPLC